MRFFPRRISFRLYFTLLLIPVVLVFSTFATFLLIWNDYKVNEKSRLASQALVFDTFISAVQQPLIQGSFIETKNRSAELLKSGQLSCVEISVGSDAIVRCEKDLSLLKNKNVISRDLTFSSSSPETFGKVTLTFDNSDLETEIWQKVGQAFIVYVALGLLLYAGLSVGLGRMRKELTKVLHLANDSKKSKTSPEFRISEFESLSARLIENMSLAQNNAEARAALEVVRQVRHDVRVQLSALHCLTASLGEDVPREKRELLLSIGKNFDSLIHELNLKEDACVTPETDQKAIVELIVSESAKELETIWTSKKNIRVSLRCNFQDMNFVPCAEGRLKRVLNNVIQNAFEAVGDIGKIEISVERSHDGVVIKIVDDGIGVPPEDRIRVFDKGISKGKKDGTGLGLHYVRECIETWGGTVYFNDVQVGSELVIKLKRVSDAPLATAQVDRPSGVCFVIDDDAIVAERIRSVWPSNKVKHFPSCREFTDWIAKAKGLVKTQDVFLVDFNFRDSTSKGTDILSLIPVGCARYLVTSDYVNDSVMSEGRNYKATIVPKSMIFREVSA